MVANAHSIAQTLDLAFEERNRICEAFFKAEAENLADIASQMAKRFQAGGRLLAFGRGPYATDAQHVSVEFVHPVIVGKRALPALDLSAAFTPWLAALVQPDDIVIGFARPDGDPEIAAALAAARARHAMIVELPDDRALHPFVHQELVEILYHTLWETVHVFLEHSGVSSNAGEAQFLYPFLGDSSQQPVDDALRKDAAVSIVAKATEDSMLRRAVARTQVDAISAAVSAMRKSLDRGGKLILLGNGGSATDANDWAIDCVLPPPGYRPIPAISLALEPANITALANDVGVEVVFLRQLIAQARPNDIVVAISTSGGSKNIIAALEEARRRKLVTVALLGYDGGEIVRRKLADHAIIVDCDYIPRIQEVQASIYHEMRNMLEVRHA